MNLQNSTNKPKKNHTVLPTDNLEPTAVKPTNDAKKLISSSGVKATVQIVDLSSKNSSQNIGGLTSQKKRRRWLLFSFLFFVIIPICLGSFYYIEVASDRYVSGAGFTVRGVSSSGGFDGLAAFTGIASSGSTTSDSYIIMKYLKSRDIVERLQQDVDIRAAYSAEEIDIISRLNVKYKIEDFVDYWDSRISVSFDATSGVLIYEVQAFNAKDAKLIADHILLYITELVNRLSKNARQDSVHFAVVEVASSEERLRKQMLLLREFREKEQSINPAARAQLDAELITTIRSRLIDINTRIAAIEKSVNKNAPSLLSLQRQAEALKTQIVDLTKNIGVADGGSNLTISALLSAYEGLEVEKEFAQKAYASALASLEVARVDADRQQRYLAVFSNPALPEQAIYPRRISNIILLIIVVMGIWGIGTLIVYSVKDHLS